MRKVRRAMLALRVGSFTSICLPDIGPMKFLPLTPWVPKSIQAVIMSGSYITHLIVSFVCSLD